MTEPFLVEISLERLRQKFNLPDATRWHDDRVRDWLRDVGFVEVPGGWGCEGVDLNLLATCEINSLSQA